jgi:hypothetical protein
MQPSNFPCHDRASTKWNPRSTCVLFIFMACLGTTASAADHYVLKAVTTSADAEVGGIPRLSAKMGAGRDANTVYTRDSDGSITAVYVSKYGSRKDTIKCWPRLGKCEFKTVANRGKQGVTATGTASWSVPPERINKTQTWNSWGSVNLHQIEKANTGAVVDLQFDSFPADTLMPIGEAEPKDADPWGNFGRNRLNVSSNGEPNSARGERRVRVNHFWDRDDEYDLTINFKIHLPSDHFLVQYHYEIVSEENSEEQEEVVDPRPSGLRLEADRKVVDAGTTFSVPVYLRYRGPGNPPELTNMNFEIEFRSDVLRVLPHPNPERKPSWTNETLEPELPRGNLLTSGTLIAGNVQSTGRVRVGFAGKHGIQPGTGRAGETVTEVYFQAIGAPGDETDLNLTITTAHDTQGHTVEVVPVHGHIKIRDVNAGGGKDNDGHARGDGGHDRGDIDSTGSGPDHSDPIKAKERWTALDAYKALLMSVERMESTPLYDVDQDNDVTSRDSTVILKEAIRVRAR